MSTLLKSALVFCLMFLATDIQAQLLTSPPSGGNKRATVTEQIGITDVTIVYDRPAVKGREGKIWGTNIAHYGFKNLGFGSSKAAPWRAGANKNTTISFSDDVSVEGKALAAGTYALFMALEENETTVIFSKATEAWGSYFYDEKDDALRVTVSNKDISESVERLRFEFIDQSDNAATVALSWENRMIPFSVETDYVNQQIASFKRELTGSAGFVYQSYMQAAQFCLQNKTELEQALAWSESAVSGAFVGQKNFETLSIKAQVLTALNRTSESEAVMKDAVKSGGVDEINQYARILIAQGKTDQALEIFHLNQKNNPSEFTPLVGLARGYSAAGDYKKALKYLKKALPKATDDLNRDSITAMIAKLVKGEDVN